MCQVVYSKKHETIENGYEHYEDNKTIAFKAHKLANNVEFDLFEI